MVFSSISKGKCFGLSVGLVWFWVWVWFFSFANSLLLALTSRNDLFNMVWICFEIFLLSISKVGVLVWVLAWCWFWVWVWFFSFANSLLPTLTSRNDLFNMVWI